MGKISFVPVGGLANRFRAMASALALAEKTGSKLDFYWFQDWALNAPFDALFQPIHIEGVAIHPSSPVNLLIYNRPRKKNLWIPLVFQKLLFRNRLYEKTIYKLRLQTGYFTNFVKEGRSYIASYHAVIPYEQRHLQALFKPVAEVQKALDERLQKMSEQYIGVHIRRTDNVDSIQHSPTELFYEQLDAELKLHPQTSIYLATDSEEVKKAFSERYGKNVTFSHQAADRNSISGIREALVEMLLLAHAQKIYGSYGSSYSELAADFGGNELIILKKA